MALTIVKQIKEGVMRGGFKLSEDVFLDENGKVFKKGVSLKRRLLARKGKAIDQELAAKLGLGEPAAIKSAVPAEDKGSHPAADKSVKKAEKK